MISKKQWNWSQELFTNSKFAAARDKCARFQYVGHLFCQTIQSINGFVSLILRGNKINILTICSFFVCMGKCVLMQNWVMEWVIFRWWLWICSFLWSVLSDSTLTVWYARYNIYLLPEQALIGWRGMDRWIELLPKPIKTE